MESLMCSIPAIFLFKGLKLDNKGKSSNVLQVVSGGKKK